MVFIKNNEKVINLIAFLLVAGLCISLIPLLISSIYARPIFDDFGYSAPVKQAIQSGGGFKSILSAVWNEISYRYETWQGTYAAIGLFSLQPAVFSDNLYFLTTFVMLSALILSTFFFVLTVMGAFGYKKVYGVICSCIVLVLSIHFVIDKFEAFFWWNGSSYYTLFYAFSLVYFAILLRLYTAKKTAARIACFVFALILAALIGGGNYSTALVTSAITALAVLAVFKAKKKLVIFYVLVFAVLAAGFVISIIAPGNSVRAATVSGLSPVKAIIMSVIDAAVCLAEWTGVTQLAGFAIIAVIALYLTKNSGYQFRYPLVFAALSFLIFASQMTPPLYAMGTIGAGRQINIYYYSYYLLASINLFYLCGWINKKAAHAFQPEKPQNAIVITVSVAACFLISGCLNHGIRSLTFVDTLLALKHGTPQAYSAEYDAIMAEIESGDTQIRDIQTYPDFFSPLDVNEDTNHWINRQIAQYHNVDQISLEPTE